MNLNDYLQGQRWSGFNSDYPDLFVSIYSEVFVIGLSGLSQGNFIKNFQYNQEDLHLAPQEAEPPGSRSQVQPGNENTEALPQGARSEKKYCR
ncbi:hypothetical protein [Microseira wollei]|nr:hypothetical protein [Microseira wollei]